MGFYFLINESVSIVGEIILNYDIIYNKEVFKMWLYVFIAIIAVVLIVSIIVYNILVRENNKVREAFATMDVYLKKRWDLIPNIVETVKGYAEHEKETLTSVVDLRNKTYENKVDEEKIELNEKLSNGIKKLMALSEAYPNLKADSAFRDLSDQLKTIEDEIANSRKYYNATVRDYNNKVEMFPSNLFAKIFGFKIKNMFEAYEEERQNVKVRL